MNPVEPLRFARAIASAGALAVLLAPAGARADDTDACLAASDSGQKDRDNGHLIEARKQLLACSRDVCPRLVRNDCGKWASDVLERLPTVVFGARDAHGADLIDVGVEIDGVSVTTKLEGRPLPVDPGEHHIRFTREGSAPVEQTVVLREREKGRSMVVEFGGGESAAAGASEATPAPAAASGPPVLAYILGGVGALSLGSFAYFGITGQSDASNLRKTCAPNCSDSSVSDVRQKLLIADVSLGVGVVSLAFAGYFLLTSRHHDDAPAQSGSVSLDVTPVAGGHVASVSGRF
jgi:hypothetical protein